MFKTAIISCLLSAAGLVSGCLKAGDPVGQDAPGAWKLVREHDPSLYYRGLHFVDRSNGWVVGDSGRVLHTSDGGTTWTAQPSGSTDPLKCVFFVDTWKGWIGGGNNSIGSTSDGGATWTWQHPVGKARRMFMGVSFADQAAGWIVDNNSGILHTANGGTTWEPQTSATTWAITAVQFLNAREGWAVSTNRQALHTTDGGATWASTSLDALDYGIGVTAIFNDVFFYTPTRGWIATNVLASGIADPIASVVRTTDGGKTWTSQRTPERQAINTIHFVDENTGWGAGNGGVCSTTDGGSTWEYQVVNNDDRAFVDLSFIDRRLGWALTSHGAVYRYEATDTIY